MEIETRSPLLSRRDFIKVTAGTSLGLLISIYLEGCAPTPPPGTTAPTTNAPSTDAPPVTHVPTLEADIPEARSPFEANAYIQIDPDGQVTITVHRPEMGQGVRTALAMAAADELEADWSTIRTIQAPADTKYGNQVAGGSDGMARGFDIYRRAGAAGRAALIAAAARVWGVEPETCIARSNEVIHEPTGSRLTYAQLVGAVTQRDVPSNTPLKDPADFRIIGTRVARVEGPEIVIGATEYGLDVMLPGMLFAVVARCPVFGGTVASFNDSAARAVPGVIDIVPLEYGVAVVAEHTWAAMQGRDALAITWDEGENITLSSAEIHDSLLAAVASDPASVEGIGGVAQSLGATYDVPFLAHMPMEPMNCTADVRGSSAEVWAPTQDPQGAAYAVAQATGISLNNVTLHVPQIGGGFGRRLEVDYAPEAARISQAVGAPVKVMWTREDDVQHDYYRPMSAHSLSGGLDAAGNVIAWRHTVASYYVHGDESIRAGARPLYTIPDREANILRRNFGVPTGAWRSVFNSQNAFAVECFLDELAELGGRDPYELRRDLLGERAGAVLDRAAQEAGWGAPLPAGKGRGIAYWSTWGTSHVAEVAEVTVNADGTFHVDRVVCVVDCGRPVNLDGVEAQAEGGIIFALAAMMQEITVEDGRVQQSNFHDFPHTRIGEAPQIDVIVLPSERDPSGMGEMTGPPLTAAVVNAIYAAAGKRIRHMPIRPEELRAS